MECEVGRTVLVGWANGLLRGGTFRAPAFESRPTDRANVATTSVVATTRPGRKTTTGHPQSRSFCAERAMATRLLAALHAKETSRLHRLPRVNIEGLEQRGLPSPST
jgi:hypothetical protein